MEAALQDANKDYKVANIELAEADARSRAIVAQMRDEEEAHGANAHDAGAAPLPEPVRGLMKVVAGFMKATAYRF